MVLVLVVASFSFVPLVGADHTADAVPSDQTISVTDNVDLWDRSILPLRVTTEPDKAIPNAQWSVIDHDRSFERKLSGKQTIGAYTRSQGKVKLKFQAANADAIESEFHGKDTHLIAAHIEENVGEDDLPEDPQNMTTDQALAFLTHENVNANASFYDAGNGTLSPDGDREYSFPLGNKPTGQYVFFLAIGEGKEDGFVVNDETHELSSTGHSTIVGVDTMMLQAGHSGAEFKNKDSAKIGDDLTFSVDVSDDLDAKSVEHTIIVYDEATGFKDQKFSIERSGTIDSFEDLQNNTTLSSSVEEVNGVAMVDDTVAHSGLLSLDTLLQEVAGSAAPQTKYDVENGPLDASITTVAGNSKGTITVETLDNWAKNTPYRWVHIAVGENSSDVITDTGKFHFNTDGSPTDPGDGNDGDDGKDDDKGNDGNKAPGGGGGGGGGGGAIGPPSTIVEVSTPGTDGTNTITISNARSGKTVRINFLDVDSSVNGMAFDQINLVPGVGGNFEMSATPLTAPPSGTPAVEGAFGTEQIGYFQIDHDIDNSDVERVEFDFEVEKSKLQGQNLDNVVLYRYHDGAWSALETEHEGSSGNFHEFSAVSPGLSVFAVGVSQPDISVTDAQLGQSEIDVGDSVTVEATVTNDGDGAGSQTVELTVDGNVVAQKTVELAGGESTTVELTNTFDSAGEYEIAVSGTSAGTLTVVGEDGPTDPSEEQTETPEEKEDGGLGIGAWILIALVLIAVVGGAAYYYYREQQL